MKTATTIRCLGLFARIALVLGLLLNSTMGWAQLAAWDFTGENTAVATSAADVYNANLDASSNVTRGATAAASAANNSFRTTGFQNNGIALTNTDYFQCTLSAAAGSTLSLSTIDARFAGTGTYAASPGVTMQFAYSLDGSTFTLIGSAQVLVGTPSVLTQVSLTGISALQNVAASTTVTLRYYASGQTATGGWGFTSTALGLYGLAIGGTVDAPASIGTPNPTALTGFTTTQGTASSSQTFSITGSNLAADLVCTAQSTDFELREQGTPTFSSSAAFTPSNGSVSKTVEVRLSATAAAGAPSSSVLITSGTVQPQSITLSGTVNPNGAPDCLGVLGGTALPGTTCNDNDACTTNDIYLATCACAGTFQDTDGDNTCDANDGCPTDGTKTAPGNCGCGNPEPGASCDDGDPCTTGDVLTSCSICTGTATPDTDGDGVCDGQDGCPLDGSKIFPGVCGCGVLEIGNICDDGNACTVNDVYTSCGVCAGSSPSDIWNFGPTSPGTASPTTSNIPNLTGGAVTQNNNFGTNVMLSTTSASSNPGASGGVNAVATAVAGALSTTTSTYFEVSLTPAAGSTFSLNGISFNTRSTGTGPTAYSVRTSADNYAFEAAGGSITNSPVAWTAKSNTGLSVSNGTAAPLVVRIYGYNATNPTASAGTWRIDDLVITGCTSQLSSYTLTIARIGAGSGVVSSTPAGITCGTTCAHTFASGTVVDLSVTPDAGSAFAGWSGDCTGSSCSVSMTQDRTVTVFLDLDSDNDGISDSSDPCQATPAVAGSPLFVAASCGAAPGAFLTFAQTNGLQVAVAVETCPAGYSCTGGSAPAVACPAGRFSDAPGAAVCQSCAAGTYSPVVGATECLSCAGSTDVTPGGAVCLDYPGSPYCPSGSALPSLSGGSGGPFTCSDGTCSSLVMNPATGEVDLVASAPGLYTVCASGACVALEIRPPAVLDPPTVALSSGTNPTCSSSPVEFHATGTYSDGSSYDSDVSYVWSDGGGTIPSGAFFAVASPVSGPVSVSVTSARACSSSTPVASNNPIDLVVNPSTTLSPPVVSLTGGTNPTCSGSPMEFHATGTYSDGSSYDSDVSYVWSDGGGTIPSGAFFAVASPVSGPVSVSVTSARACSSSTPVASNNPIDLVVNPSTTLSPPVVSLTGGTNPTCSSSPVQFQATGTYSDGSSYDSDVSYAWSVGGGTDEHFLTIAAPVSGQVSVSVTSARACSSTTPVASSNSIDLVVTPVLSIDPNSLAIEQTVGTPATCSGSAMEFHLTGVYGDGSSATNDLSATWSAGTITIVGQGFGFTADASSSAVSASDVTSSRSCVSNSGTVLPPADFALSVAQSVSLSTVSLDVTSGSNPTCAGSPRQLTATGTFSDGTSFASRPPAEMQYDFFLGGQLVQSSTSPLYMDGGVQENPLFVSVSSTRACLAGTSPLASSAVSLQVSSSVLFALDADNDNYSVTGSEVSACSAPSSQYRPVSSLSGDGDCDDSRADVHPGATEVCDGSNVDEDCDGLVDEQDYVFFADADADGDGAYEGTTTITVVGTCTLPPAPPAGFASTHTDCDDADATVHAGAPELCDGKDNDCSGSVSSDEIDNDGDFYVECAFTGAAWPVGSLVVGGGDCDDSRADVHPGANETCDGVDDDCDGLADEGDNVYYRDVDGDTYGDNSVTVSLVCTSPPQGFVSTGGDCDDSDASRHPGADEDCDGIDQDCDGAVDEGDNVYYRDLDGDTYGDNSVTVSLVCTSPPQGFVSNSGDCDDSNASRNPGADEDCDGIDQDCDGTVDEGDNVYFADLDNDGYGDDLAAVSLVCTTPPQGFVGAGGDCDDTDPARHPNALEVCDGVDQDCDGTLDEGDNVFYRDADSDTYGDVGVSVSLACTTPPVGFVSNSGDCDDTNAAVHPGATETCDGVDEDCDGLADDADSGSGNAFFRDADGDTYGDASVSVSLVCTSPPSGYVSNSGDCDDTNAAVHPGATETCDGGDDDCDGLVDDGDNVYYRDLDGDTYGDNSVTVSLVCTSPPQGFVSTGGDCDDTDAARHPNALEVCDGIDQDCDGAVDEGDNVYFADVDNDGFGDDLVTVSLVCTSPPQGFVSTGGDCDDTRLLYADTDGDGIGAGAPVACGVQSNTDNCPNVQGQIGSACDDGNTATTNDVLNSACICAGSGSCLTNPVVLTLTTDADADQLHWYVMLTGTNTEVCSGTGLAGGTTLALDCCLPDGCYDLVITDDFGDGIVGGGYVLRDGTGKRIIDNAGNGGSFTTLSLSPLGFCVPLGGDALQAASCDVENATTTTVLRAEPNAAVTAQYGLHNGNSGYQFWVTNPNGGFSRRILFTHVSPGSGAPAGTPAALKASYFLLSSMNSSAPVIPPGILLNVRVRTEANGVFSNFGPACRLIIPIPACATTQLTTTASPVVSCGATGLTSSSVIWANSVVDATGYQFEFSKAGYTRRILSATRSQALSFITLPLQMNSCYQVRVRISYDNSATYCPFGPYCTITLGTANCGTSGMALDGGEGEAIVAEEARLSIWPNPNDGSLMNISFTGFDQTVNTVIVNVTDIYGKLVSTRTLPAQDGYLNTSMSFDQEIAPGLYLVNLQAGEQRLTQRLVIQ